MSTCRNSRVVGFKSISKPIKWHVEISRSFRDIRVRKIGNVFHGLGDSVLNFVISDGHCGGC
jgi:hypothetical protein